MKRGLLPAAVVLIGYLAFEAYTLQKAAYRMEPLYLFEQYILAGSADALCGAPDPERRERFEHNRRFAYGRAARELRERRPGIGDAEIDADLAARVVERENEVAALVDERGCDNGEIRTLLKRYEVRSRRFIG